MNKPQERPFTPPPKNDKTIDRQLLEIVGKMQHDAEGGILAELEAIEYERIPECTSSLELAVKTRRRLYQLQQLMYEHKRS